jgi:hypothetical protein
LRRSSELRQPPLQSPGSPEPHVEKATTTSESALREVSVDRFEGRYELTDLLSGDAIKLDCVRRFHQCLCDLGGTWRKNTPGARINT